MKRFRKKMEIFLFLSMFLAFNSVNLNYTIAESVETDTDVEKLFEAIENGDEEAIKTQSEVVGNKEDEKNYQEYLQENPNATEQEYQGYLLRSSKGSLSLGNASCEDVYSMDKLGLSIESKDNSVSAGKTIEFEGKIKSSFNHPIVGLEILGKIYLIDERDDYSNKNGDYQVDEKYLLENISLMPGESQEVSFKWKAPQDLVSGQYQVDFYVTKSKKYNLGGVNFLNTSYVERTYFSVENKSKTNKEERIYIDKDSLNVDGQVISLRNPSLDAKEEGESVIGATIVNKGKKKESIKLIKSLYKWDAINSDNLVESQEIKIDLNSGESKYVEYVLKEDLKNFPVYVIRYQIEGQSMVDVRFGIPEQAYPRINYISLEKFPLEKEDNFDIYTCFHNMGSSQFSEGKIEVEAKDKEGNIIASLNYEDGFSSPISAIKDSFQAEKDYNYIDLSVTAYDKDDNITEKDNFVYDCDSFNNLEGCEKTVVDDFKDSFLYILGGLIIFVLVIVLIYFMMKKNKNKKITGIIIAIIFVLVGSITFSIIFNSLNKEEVNAQEEIFLQSISFDEKQTVGPFYENVGSNDYCDPGPQPWTFPCPVGDGDGGCCWNGNHPPTEDSFRTPREHHLDQHLWGNFTRKMIALDSDRVLVSNNSYVGCGVIDFRLRHSGEWNFVSGRYDSPPYDGTIYKIVESTDQVWGKGDVHYEDTGEDFFTLEDKSVLEGDQKAIECQEIDCEEMEEDDTGIIKGELGEGEYCRTVALDLEDPAQKCQPGLFCKAIDKDIGKCAVSIAESIEKKDKCVRCHVTPESAENLVFDYTAGEMKLDVIGVLHGAYTALPGSIDRLQSMRVQRDIEAKSGTLTFTNTCGYICGNGQIDEVDVNYDGTPDYIEECDPAMPEYENKCNDQCELIMPVCGDGIAKLCSDNKTCLPDEATDLGRCDENDNGTLEDEETEQCEVCDDGDLSLSGICRPDCMGFTYCGDGYVQTPNGNGQNEICDCGTSGLVLPEGYSFPEMCTVNGVFEFNGENKACNEYCRDDGYNGWLEGNVVVD